MRLMDKDLKRKWTEADEQSLEDLMTKGVAAFITFVMLAFCFTAFSLASAQPVAPADITAAVTDNLMSEDMASYTVLYGRNETYTEWDME